VGRRLTAWEDGTPVAAAMAKAIAGRAARLVAKHCQQVLAGIGFTDEHEFHTYFRRVLLLDALLGDARSLTKAQGAELLRTRELPGMLPL
jgi:alkylation response protein AidB-like acyl-CoA dehydrogenase